MSYRLQADESLANGLKRINSEEIAAALNQLQSGNVYRVRKHLKKIRALLRLVKPWLGPAYIEENRRLRDIARSFSALRDLDVSIELLDRWATQGKRKTVFAAPRKSLCHKRSALQAELDFADPLRALSAFGRRAEDRPLSAVTPQSLYSQLARTHCQSRRAFLLAQDSRRPEDFHEFRKSIKRELNQSRILNAAPLDLEPLKKLSTLLGDHHNLVVLLQNMEDVPARIQGTAHRRMRNYETQIVSLAARVYGSNPVVCNVSIRQQSHF